MSFPFRRSLRAAITLAVTVAALLAFAPGAFAASTATFDATELFVSGGDADETITITRNGSDLVTGGAIFRIVDTTGVTPLAGCVRPDPLDLNTVDCTDPSPTVAKSIRFAGHGGNDTLSAGCGQDAATWGTTPARIIGRQGDDTICGSPVNDEIEGGVGADDLNGGPGDDFVSGGGEFVDGATQMGIDVVNGGAGDDTVSDGEARGDAHDGDTLGGGPGAGDRLYMYDVPAQGGRRGLPRNGAITVNLTSGTAGEAGENNAVSGLEIVVTGDGNDSVTGGPGVNEFYTQGGNDFINSIDSPATADDIINCGDGTEDALQADAEDPAGIGCEVTGVPAAPTGVAAVAAGQNGITVSWTDNTQATTYDVFRRQPTDSGTTAVATTGGTSAQITGLTAGTRYCFAVQSVNRFGRSVDSTVACATTATVSGTPGGGGGSGGTGTGGTGGGSSGGNDGVEAGPSRTELAQAARTASAGAARALARTRLGRLLSRGLTVRGSTPGAGSVTFTLGGRVGGKRLTVASKRITRSSAGSYSLKLKASKAARKRLRGVRRITVTLTVRYTTRAGLTSTVTRRVTLKR